jgi:hypothetical protein
LPDYSDEGLQDLIRKPSFIVAEGWAVFEDYYRFLSNLKRECFVDSDLENVTLAYGTRPNVPLTVLGLVTSIPTPGNETFDPTAGVEQDVHSEEGQLEAAFRGMFRAFEQFERFVRFSRYPRVTVYPIAAFQRLDKKGRSDMPGASSGDASLVVPEPRIAG